MNSSKLAALPLFDGLPDTDLDRCAELFQETEMLAGSSLTKEGEFSYKFFVVLDGEVEVQRDFEHLATLGTGDFFGEVGVMTGERRNARVIALTRCQLAWVMPWDFQTITDECPLVAERVEAKVAERQ